MASKINLQTMTRHTVHTFQQPKFKKFKN